MDSGASAGASDVDSAFMRRAIELAESAAGQTSPNPLVGCVVVDRHGQVIGEGFHPKAGESHAEVFALDRALGEKLANADEVAHSTLYCTLEPCCHWGRTPPCVKKIIESGIKRVVIGTGDPNPKVEGGGIKALRDAGVEVVVGVLAPECRYQNRAFFKTMERGLPWVALKMAVTLDGKIADRDGSSRWISGPESRELVMQLRSHSDAVIVGGGTAKIDDPSLTVRDIGAVHCPVRVVIDSNLSLPLSAKVLSEGARTILLCNQAAAERTSASAYLKHVQVMAVESDAAGRLDMRAALRGLRDIGLNNCLCEGGARLAADLIDNDLVDEVFWFIAPKILADQESLSAILSPQPRLMGRIVNLVPRQIRVLGDDVMMHGLLHQP